MDTKKTLPIILNSIIIALFLASGIITLVLRSSADSYNNILLGSILLVVGFSKAVIYYINLGFKNKHNVSIIGAVLMIGLGFVFLFGNKETEMLCFGWGIMEIALGLIEVYVDVIEIRENNKIAILEVIVNTATIVFGVLLCIHLSSGLTVHLIFLGISLILLGVIATIKLISSLRGE